MTMEGSYFTPVFISGPHPAGETSDAGNSELAHEIPDDLPNAWENAWIDIGGEG